MTLADRIKEERIRKGLSQSELASLINTKQQIIHKLESGIIKNPRNIKNIATALNTTPEYLLFGKKQDISYQINILLASSSELDAAPNGVENEVKKILLPENYFSIIVEDESMITVRPEPSFPPGTIIIIDPSKKAEVGNLVVIKYQGKFLFRKLINTGKHLRFAALNPSADWFMYEEADIIGVVVASMNLDL